MGKSKNQRFRLLTTCIVAALHPNQQQVAGAVWEPTNVIDQQEAEALRGVGYAEHCNDDVTHLTVLQQQDAAKAKAADAETGDDSGNDTNDGWPKPAADILAGNVDEVTAELENLSVEQLDELSKLEAAGQSRKGVQNAIEHYRKAKAE